MNFDDCIDEWNASKSDSYSSIVFNDDSLISAFLLNTKSPVTGFFLFFFFKKY